MWGRLLDVGVCCACACWHVDLGKCSMHGGQELSKSGGGQLASARVLRLLCRNSCMWSCDVS